MKILRLVSRVLLALSVVVVAAIVGLWLYLPSLCGNDVLEVFPSPDGAKKIVVFQRDCGATTGFSTQASLLSSSEVLSNAPGNVFSADTNHGAAASGPGGGPALGVAWRSGEVVALSHYRTVRVFKAEEKVDGVRFIYSAMEDAGQQGTPLYRSASASMRKVGG